MKNIILLSYILLIPFLSFSNCLEEQLLKLGQSIKYPTIFWENDIEDTLTINIIENNINLIEGRFSAFKEELLNKSLIERISNCEFQKATNTFFFEFKLGEIDTFYIVNNSFIFQKKAIEYYTIPASINCSIYPRSKISIKKNKIKHRSKATILNGQRIVFQYQYKSETNPYNYYSDGEHSKIITFQVNNHKIDSFEYIDSDLKRIKLHFKKISNTTSVKTYFKRTIFGTKQVTKYNESQGLINRGYVKGRKIDEKTWIIEIQFDDIHIKEIFIMNTINK